jgi:hypothetical protein
MRESNRSSRATGEIFEESSLELSKRSDLAGPVRWAVW